MLFGGLNENNVQFTINETFQLQGKMMAREEKDTNAYNLVNFLT